MDEPPATSWLTGQPLRGFALPRGRLGRLMGALMARANGAEQAEVLAAVRPMPGEHVVEVGYGPGALVAALLRAGATVTGVDPSAEMRDMARRRNAAAVRDGYADLRTGTAEQTALPDAAADAVVSVNNVPMWSDLAAGMAELRRITRPGGRVVVSWHGGDRPVFTARKMPLPDATLERIRAAMAAEFGDAERRDLHHVVVFTASRND
ncbi:MAG TPA: class I SAM-dependent methyltransferase [Streptosporangiales bacterium]